MSVWLAGILGLLMAGPAESATFTVLLTRSKLTIAEVGSSTVKVSGSTSPFFPIAFLVLD